MKKIISLILLLSLPGFAQDNVSPKIMAHYMPWYQTPEIHGYWGYHWTMDHFNPGIIHDGKREIASHYYPLTGPYDSSDKLILEYQTLLMILSGIDGVLVDWYGIENFWDYGTINESTGKLFNAIEKAGLSFAIVYEDQTIKHMVNNGRLNSSNALSHGKSVMKYLHDNWFVKDTYMKLNGQPLLLTFGPQYFSNSSDWTSLFSDISLKPSFYTLDNRLAPAAAGAYPWPPMWKSVNGILSQSSLNDYLNQFYQKAAGYDYLVTSAFPGFHDIYEEAGVGASYGYLASQDGVTLKATLTKALQNNPDVIQIATWNDYGEGTIIEPTNEFKYSYLEIIQSAKDSLDPAFEFKPSDLTLPLRIFNLRKQYKGNTGINGALDRVYDFILSRQADKAAELLDSITSVTSIDVNPNVPGKLLLEQNYPNPFNPVTTIKFSIAEPGFVSLKVFDMLGKEVAVLIDEMLTAADNVITFDASGLSSGIYTYRLRTNGHSVSKKMMVIK